MIGGRLLGRTRDGALRYGRMTCEDVAELGTVFAQVGSRQARDTLFGLRRRLAGRQRAAAGTKSDEPRR